MLGILPRECLRTPFQTVSKRSTLSIECAKGVGYAPYPSAQREAISEGAYTPCTYLRRSHKPSEIGYPDTSSPISWPETLLWHCPLLLLLLVRRRRRHS